MAVPLPQHSGWRPHPSNRKTIPLSGPWGLLYPWKDSQSVGVVWLPQEEMYIFMEYCDEGTLEEVSRLGLQEHVIRLYTKQITVAINVLHEHGIVHRDIKGTSSTWPHRQATVVLPLAGSAMSAPV